MSGAIRHFGARFAFGVFDLLEALPIDHQYRRIPPIVRPGQKVRLRVATHKGYGSVEVVLRVGSGPVTASEVVAEGRVVSAVRGEGDWWAELPPMPDGAIVHYVVRATDEVGRVWYADGRRPERAATVFCHRVTSRHPPDWAAGSVIYQIVVDRFCAPGEALPDLEPGRSGQWLGGDLDQVRRAVPYLADLGISIIWLTPVFACRSYHGYDTVDFSQVDERFGGERALGDLVRTAHRSGLRVVLDLVPNHISNEHPWFQEALAGGPRRDWFHFREGGTYDSFMGGAHMPKLNLDHPQARGAMIEVARSWLDRLPIDGYRLDHMVGPSVSFFADLAAELNRTHPQAWIFGEATASAEFIVRYGGILDGATDFPTCYALRDLVSGDLTEEQFRAFDAAAGEALGHDEFSWIRFADNHDMDRITWVWREDRDRIERGLALLLSLSGVPGLLYGTEQGLSQSVGTGEGGLEAARVPMRYDDRRLHAWVRTRLRSL